MTTRSGLGFIGVLVVLVLHCTAGAAMLENLAYNATGSGTLPSAGLNQGTTGGIFDGNMFAWLGGGTSPRLFAPATNIQPYMTWSTDQTIRSTRVWFDTTNNTPSQYDRLVIDTLRIGGSATVEADWQQRYDTGLAFAKPFLDADLGADITTRGLRVRAFKTSADINVGEVAVFKPFMKPGTLTANRITPTGASASSTSVGSAASANDAFTGVNNRDTNLGWYGRWASNTPLLNPGSTYTLDVTLTPGSTVDGLSLTFAPQGGFSALPTMYTLYAERGAGFVSLGTFSTTATPGRLHYYHDLAFGLNGVNALRLEVNESDVPSGLRLAVYEFEAFNLPEPTCATWLLCAAGWGLLVRRRS